jgi:hypothetical protein
MTAQGDGFAADPYTVRDYAFSVAELRYPLHRGDQDALVEAFVEGATVGEEYAHAQVAPLIEAARAYRDARVEADEHWDGAKYDRALMSLLEAARTFEVSHEGQG